MSTIGSQQVLDQLRDMKSQMQYFSKKAKSEDSANDQSASFIDHLKSGVKQVNDVQKTADQLAIELASGKSDNIQETMLAAAKAELSFNLLVQVRNKVLEAYQEVMRMQV